MKTEIYEPYEHPLVDASELAPETNVLNMLSAYSIEVSNLSELISRGATTHTARLSIRNTLFNPSLSLEQIEAKQDSLREIRSNATLRQEIEKFLCGVNYTEGDARRFRFFPKLENYEAFKELISVIQNFSLATSEPETLYLRSLRHDLARLRGGKAEELIKSEKRFKRATKYFSGGLFCVSLGASLAFRNPYLAVLGTVGALSLHRITNSVDCKKYISPISELSNYDPDIRNAFRAVGDLGELIAFDRFGGSLKHATLPKLTDSDKHYFRAKNLINAVQSSINPSYMPNDIDIGDGSRLVFLTGPNSGGKSSLCKTIAQAQVLAQAGCYVPADFAEMGLCDGIFYQIGVNDHLSSDEGGLGTQLKVAKEILFSSTPRSLVIIDDLIDGTTFREKTEQTRDQLCGFLHKGADTIFVTHHHELAQEFASKKVGRYLQAGFNCKKPTYKMIQGISTNSHADAVAERVGVDGERIREHLISEGYLPSNMELRDISKYAGQ